MLLVPPPLDVKLTPPVRQGHRKAGVGCLHDAVATQIRSAMSCHLWRGFGLVAAFTSGASRRSASLILGRVCLLMGYLPIISHRTPRPAVLRSPILPRPLGLKRGGH